MSSDDKIFRVSSEVQSVLQRIHGHQYRLLTEYEEI